MRFDKFVASLAPEIKASNATMNMFYSISFLNTLYYIVYPKFLEFKKLAYDQCDECDEIYDITSSHIITLAWAVFFFIFALIFNSALSLMINFVSLAVAVLTILSIVVILSKRERVMFKEFGRKIQND